MAVISSSICRLAIILGLIVVSISIDDKCAACNAVAGELEIELANEKPRNYLDLRNRLDSKGQRRGKVIDYRLSELRVVELLDGLCEKMQDYTLQKKINLKEEEWIKVRSWENLTINKQEARAHSKDISSYCGRLLEQTEDELAELFKKGSVKPGRVGKVLCEDLSQHCTKTSGSQGNADSDDDDNDDDDDDDDDDDEL